MKSLVFDTSSLISIATNEFLWLMEPLKKLFQGDFVIPDSVRYEIIERPSQMNRFKLESIRVSHLVHTEVLQVHSPLQVDALLEAANTIFFMRGKPMHVVDKGEVEALALAVELDAAALVVDERTLRLLVENPLQLKKLFEHKFHTKVQINKKSLDLFRKQVRRVQVLRSSELLTIAVERGLLNTLIDQHHSKQELLDAILWGLRLRGCAISTQEIAQVVKMYK